LENADVPPFKHYSLGNAYGQGAVSYNSETFIAPVAKSRKIYLTLDKDLGTNGAVEIYIVARR